MTFSCCCRRKFNCHFRIEFQLTGSHTKKANIFHFQFSYFHWSLKWVIPPTVHILWSIQYYIIHLLIVREFIGTMTWLSNITKLSCLSPFSDFFFTLCTLFNLILSYIFSLQKSVQLVLLFKWVTDVFLIMGYCYLLT